MTSRESLVDPECLPDAHILLVEDNRVNQKVATGLLRRLGLEIELAENGVEALEKLKNDSWDLVLMDCQMPEMDGYECTRLWREHEGDHPARRLPIVAMTAAALSGDRQRCLSAGMDDYLTKPIRRDELSSILRRWLVTDSAS
jgi:CheY-like chemotaxis protein